MPVKPIRAALVLPFLASLSALACSHTPAEPDRPTAAPTAVSAPAVAPLLWDSPSSWTALAPPVSGPRKAEYKIPKAGNDKEDAEMMVVFYGTGAKGDPDKNFKEWFDQFDGNAGATAARDKLDAHGLEVDTVDVKGTYKVGLGPPVGPKKASPVSMVKADFRLYGAVVKTPDRGNWFFKLVGPDETVQAAKSAMRSMLESAR